MNAARLQSFRRLVIGFVTGLAIATPAFAQDERPVLSKQLVEFVNQGGNGTADVIFEGPQSEVDRLASAYGLSIAKRLPGGAVFTGNPGQIELLGRDRNVGRISEDAKVIGLMALPSQTTGASSLWKGKFGNFGGLTGQGITVAVIDSGIANHQDVKNRLLYSVDFTGEGDGDLYGHGTHVASLISGSGAGSRLNGGSTYVGMAPGAALISLKVLGKDGSGYVSDVIEAIEWAIANKDLYNIRVLNMSLGTPAGGSYRDDPMAKAAERAAAAGIVIVASAGNLGKLPDGTPLVGGVVSPGYTPSAITVGALNTKGTIGREDDGVATYSSRGPVGDQNDPANWELKPDLVAPGNAIEGAVSMNSSLWNDYPERRVYGASGGTYMRLSGTSMAAAVVSGAVAQVLQANPKMSPAQVKFALQYTAERLEGFGLIEQGAGSLNVPLAATMATTKDLRKMPKTALINGTPAAASQIAFANTIIWTTMLRDNTIIWTGNARTRDNTIIWTAGRAIPNTIIWTTRNVGSDTIIWTTKNVGADTIIWTTSALGGQAIAWGNTIIWTTTIIWTANTNAVAKADANTIIWTAGQAGGQPVSPDTIIWTGHGNLQNELWGNTIIWTTAINWANTIIWTTGTNGANTIIWTD